MRISQSASLSKSTAETVPGPCAFSRRIFGRLTCSTKTTFRRFIIMSSVSSVTPGRCENSWSTCSIFVPHRRGSVDVREEGAPVGDADREGEAGLEGLHDELAVVPFLDNPVVPRRKLEIQQCRPLSTDQKMIPV